MWMNAAGHAEAEGKRRAAPWPPGGRSACYRCRSVDAGRPDRTDTLKHGRYMTRVASSPAGAAAVLDEWQLLLLIFDADLDGQQLMQQVKPPSARIALMRRVDLRTELAWY